MKRSIVILMITLFSSILFSGTTGKIKGIVTDENGDPLEGANIMVVGKTWGAETDEDGYYYIIGVRAGTYQVKCQYIGYSPKMISKLKVRVGLTSSQNFKLVSETIEIDELEIEIFQDEKVEMDVTTSVRNVDLGTMETQALTEVGDVLSSVAGIKKDAEGGLHFRGGRDGEVNYVIDGISVGDPTGTKSAPVSINFANVESFNIQKGIPDAEYGDALSGSVNIVMKVGDQEKTSGHVKYSTDSFLGDSKLDYNRGEFSLSGPIPIPGMEMKPTYYLATDFTALNGFGRSYRDGGDTDGEYFAYDNYDLTNFGFEVPQMRENNFSIIFKTALDITPTMKISTSFTKQRSHNYDFDWNYIYTPETASEQLSDITIFNVNWRHTINQQSYYDLIFSYYNREFENMPGGNRPDEFVYPDDLDFLAYDFINNGARDGGDAEGYIDYNGNGYFDRETFTDNNGNGNYDEGIDVFTDANDANGNGQYDGDYLYDSGSKNNRWDYWETGQSYSGFDSDCLIGEIVEGYIDTNLSGHYDKNIYNITGDESFTDGDRYFDTGEPYIDQKRFYNDPSNGNNLVELANGRWDEGEAERTIITYLINRDNGEIYEDYRPSNFNDRLDIHRNNEFYMADISDNVSYIDSISTVINVDSTEVVYVDVYSMDVNYPKEYFEDLRSSLGSQSQTNPRFNAVYNSVGDGVFDEFEVYSKFRDRGSDTTIDNLGWESGINDGNSYIKFIGSYSVYEAPTNMYSDVPNIELIAYDAEYSTWTDNNKNGYYEGTGDSDGDGSRYDVGEDFDDFNNNGTWDQDTGFLHPGSYGAYAEDLRNDINYSLFDNTVMKFKGNYTNQIDKFHMIKTGFELVMNDFSYYSITNPYYEYDPDRFGLIEGDEYPNNGEEKTFYEYEPMEFSAFVQDKMEFEDLVVNAGLRLDMRILDKKAVDYYEEQYDDDAFGYEEEIKKYRTAISPRFGISHSISETSKLFFSYGHLYQLPNWTWIFDPNTKAGRDPAFGNMNLDYERNVQYELGIVNDLGGYLIDVTGYFKDIYDMVNYKTYEYGVTDASVRYNSDYGKSRGVEIQIDRSLKNHYLWGLGYVLSYAYGKSSDEDSNLDDDELVVKEFPLNWDERHSLTTYFTLLFGKGETLFDVPYTDNWSLSVNSDFRTGKPFTPTSDYYDYPIASSDIEENSERMPWTSNTNIKISKTFDFNGNSKNDTSYGVLKFEFSIFNAFNKVNVLSVYQDTGTWWGRSDGYYEESDNDNYTDVWKNPENIAERRHYRFGVSYNW